MKHKILLLLALCVSASMQATVKPKFATYGSVGSSTNRQNVQGYKYASVPTFDKSMVVGKRETASLAGSGSPKVPVILVQFPNKSFTAAASDQIADFYDKYCNGTRDGQLYKGAGSYGAIRDYFYDQSDGVFSPEFVIIGPVTLTNNYQYYGQNSSKKNKDIHLGDLYKEAISKTEDMGIQWSQFDNNNDGIVDMAYFIYAGQGENSSGVASDIWPSERTTSETINGVTYGAYGCCNELLGSKADGIGVMCHELSHALGFPEFYDRNYKAFGLDFWDLMDAGSYCKDGYHPCGYSAYERSFMGWRDLITLTPGVGATITIYPMTHPLGRGYKIVNPVHPNEYYIIENRQPESWDKYIGYGTPTWGYRSGLMITHVDYDEQVWITNEVNSDENHQHLTLIPADGDFIAQYLAESMEDYLASMAGDLYPGSMNVIHFKDEQQIVYYGTTMGQPITDITQNIDGSITFNFCGGEPDAIEPNPIFKTNQPRNIYDITGKKADNLDKNQFKGKIFIINGKKVLVK